MSKLRVDLENQVAQSRKVKRLEAENSRLRARIVALEGFRDCFECSYMFHGTAVANYRGVRPIDEIVNRYFATKKDKP